MSSNPNQNSEGKNTDNIIQKKFDISRKVTGLFSNPRLFIHPIFIVVVYLSLFLLLDVFSKQFEGLNAIVAWYPPAGLTYALLFVYGVKYTPAVTLALFISSLFVYHLPQPYYLVLLWALVTSLIYAGSVTVLHRVFHFDWHLRKLRDVILLIGTVNIISAILAVTAILSSAMNGGLQRSDVVHSIFIWWIGETVGVLTVTPFLFIHISLWQKLFTQRPFKRPAIRLSLRQWLAVMGQTLSIVMVFYLVFNVNFMNISRPLYLFFLPLIWIALDHGLKGSTFGIILVNFGVMMMMALSSPNLATIGELQFLMIVVCIIGLLVGKTTTDQKETEEFLRSSENRYHTLFDQSMVGVALLETKTGRYREINKKYCDLVGYTKQELLNLSFGEITFPDDIQENVNNNTLLLSGKIKQFSIEKRYIRKDGKIIWAILTASPLWRPGENPAEYFHIAVIQDITARKQQEAEILRNNQDLNLLYEAGKQISQTLDLQSIYSSFFKLVSSTMKCDTLYIAGFDQQTELITANFAVNEGKSIDVSAFPAIPLEPEGRGIQSPVIRSGKSRIINNYQEALKKTKTNYYINEDGKVIDVEDVPEDEAVTQSSLVIPILLNDQVTGIIQIQSLEKEAYKPEDMKIAEALTTQIAVAENNALLYQQSLKEIQARLQAESSLLKHAKRQEIMASLGRALVSTLDLVTIYQISEGYLKEMIDCHTFGITFFDHIKNVITVAYFKTDGIVMDPASLPPIPYDPQKASSGRSKAIAKKTPVIVYDLASKRDKSSGILFGSDQEPETAIYVPILVEREVIGSLDLQSYQKDTYSEKDGEWLSVIANQIGLAIENSRQFARSTKRISELSAMNTIASAVTAYLEPKETYDVFIDQVITQLKVDAAVLFLFDPETQELFVGSEYGYINKDIFNLRLKLGESLAGKIAVEKQLIHLDHLSGKEQDFFLPILFTEEFDEYFGVPLLANNKLIGVLEVINRSPLSVDADWLHFLNLLAGQAAVVLNTLQLIKEVLYSNSELTQAYDATIEGWSHALDLRDKETEGHSIRVTELTVKIAQSFGISDDKLMEVRWGALLHDIGKMGIPDGILLKPGPLSYDEWVLMKKHPIFAYEMLMSIRFLKDALDIPYCHHEKWDGSGYPRGLKGEQIPLAARIFAVVDVYDALTSDRTYRKAWTKEKALEHIRSESGTHFDPKVVELFLQEQG